MPHTTQLPPPARRHLAPSPKLTSRRDAIPVQCESFLKSLPNFGAGNLILRGGGLSIFRNCRLGALRYSTDGYLEDPKSGLRIQSDSLGTVWLIESSAEPSRFELEMKDSGASFAFFPPDTAGTRQELERMRHHNTAFQRFFSTPPPPSHAAWLDQELDGITEAWENEILLKKSPHAYEATIRLNSRGLSFQCLFHVTFLDMVEEVFRLASIGGETVLHLSSKSFVSKLLPDGSGLRLTTAHTSSFEGSSFIGQWFNPALNR